MRHRLDRNRGRTGVAHGLRHRDHVIGVNRIGQGKGLARAVVGGSDADGDRFEGLAGELVSEEGAPASCASRFLAGAQQVKTAIGRLQRRHVHASSLQCGQPAPVRAQPGPAAATQGQHRGAREQLELASRRGETQLAGFVPARPAVTHVELHAARAQLRQPGAQQRRGLHVGREHAARCAHEGGNAQRLRPGAHGVGVEVLQPTAHLALALSVARDKGGHGLGMRQVQPAATRQQKLAAHRCRCVEHSHAQARASQGLRGHQASRPAADDGDI